MRLHESVKILGAIISFYISYEVIYQPGGQSNSLKIIKLIGWLMLDKAVYQLIYVK